MRQKIRRVVIFVSLFCFPVTLNYFSPYVSVDGAFQGIVSGSLILFGLLFCSGLVFRRAWCAWVCPVAGLCELTSRINDRRVNIKKLAIIHYGIFSAWVLTLLAGFLLAGGIKGINPLHLTEQVVSVDEPLKYITYYFVLFLLFFLSVWIGRRGACHSICWMSPFLTAGAWTGKKLHLRQLMIKAEPSLCINCKKCEEACPMSIEVREAFKAGEINTLDCIQCGECVDTCPKQVLKFRL